MKEKKRKEGGKWVRCGVSPQSHTTTTYLSRGLCASIERSLSNSLASRKVKLNRIYEIPCGQIFSRTTQKHCTPFNACIENNFALPSCHTPSPRPSTFPAPTQSKEEQRSNLLWRLIATWLCIDCTLQSKVHSPHSLGHGHLLFSRLTGTEEGRGKEGVKLQPLLFVLHLLLLLGYGVKWPKSFGGT